MGKCASPVRVRATADPWEPRATKGIGGTITSFWLVRGVERLCPVEVARSLGDRSRGLLGRDGIDGALLLQPATSVHTFRMRFDLDVAFLDRHLVVLRTVRMRRNRLGRPVLRARSVLEAEAGAFAAWQLRVGDRLALEPAAATPPG